MPNPSPRRAVVVGLLVGLAIVVLVLIVVWATRAVPYLSATDGLPADARQAQARRSLLFLFVFAFPLAGPIGAALGALVGWAVARRRAARAAPSG